MREYRTWSIALVAIVALCLVATVGGVKGDELAHVEWGLGMYVAAVAGRAIGAAAAGGDGLRGMTRNLFTDAKPGEAPAPPAVQP